MSRSKKLYTLLGVLLVICLITFGVSRYEVHKEQIKNSDEIILELSKEDVKKLSWEYESETLAFHRDETWLYDGDEAFPVNEDKINELLEQFQEFGVSFIIENVEDYGQYGLDSPVCTIHLETDDKSYEITLGDYSKMDSQRYVSIGDGNVYLVKNDPLDYFNAALSDLIEHDNMPVFDQVTAIQFAGLENGRIVYEEDSSHTYCEDDVYFMEQDGDYLPLDTSRVSSYLSTISYLNPTDYVTYKVTEEELAAYGLDEPELSVTVDYTPPADDTGETEAAAETFVLQIGRDPEEKKAAESAAAEQAAREAAKEEDTEAAAAIEAASAEAESEEEEITAYVRVGESNIIYQITAEEYKQLTDASYDSLRHQELFTASLDQIKQITVSLEGADYILTVGQDGDDRSWYYQEEKLENAELWSTLQALRADGFTEEQPEQKEEISLTVTLENENFPRVRIELYRYDGSHCLALVDGKPVALVQRSQVVDLVEAVHAIVLN